MIELPKVTKRRLLALAAAATFGGMLFAGAAQAADPIKIAAVNPYSGPLALYGDELARGYALAIDEANAKGGVLGRKLVMIRADAGNPKQAISAVSQMATREKVDLFIGTYVSAVSNAASDAALRYKKMYWDTNALAAGLTARGLPNFVRSGPYSDSFAKVSVDVITDLIAKKLGKPVKGLKVWLEHEESIYGTSIAKAQKAALEKAGATVLGVGAHSYKSVDLTDSILRAKKAGPDVWVQTGYVPDTNLLLKTMREQGFKPGAVVLVGSGDTSETIKALGAYLDGVFVVSYPRPDVKESYGPGAAKYLAAYKAKYGRDPIAPQSMTGYVGVKMLLEAIAAAKSTDMRKIRAAAMKMDKPFGSYETGYGVKFSAKMQNTRAFPTVIQWQGGKQVTVFPAAAASADTTDMSRK